MEQKTKEITLIVVILAVTVGVVIYIAKNNAPAVQSPQNVQQAATQPESTSTSNIQEQIQQPQQATPLLPNELISMEDAAKQIGAIQDKIKAGTISAEEGQAQIDVIKKHLAPPTASETK